MMTVVRFDCPKFYISKTESKIRLQGKQTGEYICDVYYKGPILIFEVILQISKEKTNILGEKKCML
jgi:hypothetical protein